MINSNNNKLLINRLDNNLSNDLRYRIKRL